MSKEVIGASVELEYKSIGEMRKALKEGQSEVIRLQQQFGKTSAEALEAAKRVAGLRDRIKDVAETVDLFDPGNKFKALGNTVQVAAQGFTALQGAMGLLGVESKDVEKQLLKVQGAMALTEGLSGLADASKNFTRLAGVIKGPVVAAFTTLRGAMMAVGIGLFTSAIAFLVTNFERIKKVIYDTFPALNGLFDNFDRIKQIAMGVGNAILQFVATPVKALMKVIQGDFSGALEVIKNGVAFTKNFKEGEEREIKRQTEAANEERRKLQAKADKKAQAERLKRQQEFMQKYKEAEQQFTQFIQQESERQLLAQMDATSKQIFQLRKKYAEAFAIAKQFGFDTQQLEQLRVNEVVKIINQEVAERTKGVSAVAGVILKKGLPKIANAQTTLTAKEEAQVRTRIFLAETELEQKQMLYAQIADAAGVFAELIGRQTAVGKALGIAQATINTYLAASKSLAADYGPFGPFALPAKILATATTIATGLSTVRAIVRAQVPGFATTGFGGVALNTPAQPPLQPALSPTAQAFQLNTQAINNIGNQAIQAYILNSDIQNAQQINAFLQRNARI